MWTLQVFFTGVAHPMNLAFKEEAGAKMVLHALQQKLSAEVKDDYGAELSIPDWDKVAVIRVEDAEKFLEAQVEYNILQQYAQAKQQKRAASDPKLKFLSGMQGNMIGRG
jgi:hypothetical protein